MQIAHPDPVDPDERNVSGRRIGLPDDDRTVATYTKCFTVQTAPRQISQTDHVPGFPPKRFFSVAGVAVADHDLPIAAHRIGPAVKSAPWQITQPGHRPALPTKGL